MVGWLTKLAVGFSPELRAGMVAFDSERCGGEIQGARGCHSNAMAVWLQNYLTLQRFQTVSLTNRVHKETTMLRSPHWIAIAQGSHAPQRWSEWAGQRFSLPANWRTRKLENHWE